MPLNATGQVFLVGAGPGSANLLTVRAVELLSIADVVLYDGLANLDLKEWISDRIGLSSGLSSGPSSGGPKIANFLSNIIPGMDTPESHFSAADQPAKKSPEWISVGKHGSQRIWKQTEINDAMVSYAKQGKMVVRLKGGDTGIFARTGEELERLVSESIPFEIVPGITAASAVAAYAGIPITHRDWASAVALVTGHSQPSDGGPESDESFDWEAIANFPGTVVIYMGVTTVHHWSQRLMAAGKSAETPVALVRRCSWPDQETVLCTLGDAAIRMTPASKFRPPVLVVIGPVAHLGETYNWFSKRPLQGKQVLICRPDVHSDPVVDLLTTMGATVLQQPALTITAPESWKPVDEVIDGISSQSVSMDWIVFSSRYGVRSFLNRMYQRGFDARILAKVKFAGVGPSIKEELERNFLRADLIAQQPYGARSLLDAFALLPSLKGSGEGSCRVLAVGNNRTDPAMAEGLTKIGAMVTSIEAYHSIAPPSPAPELHEKLRSGTIDFCIATSPAIAQTLIGWFGKDLKLTTIVTISPAVTKIFEAKGFERICEASEPSMDAILATIEQNSRLELDKSSKSS